MTNGSDRGGKKQILISGTYGTGNFGDEKILDSIIRLTRDYYGEDTKIIVASNDPASTEDEHTISYAIPHIERNIQNYIRELRSTDHLLIGGGTIIGEPFSYRHSMLTLLGRIFASCPLSR